MRKASPLLATVRRPRISRISSSAQAIGSAIPATHFLRVIRAVMLKGGDVPDVALECGALALILVVISAIAMLRYRQTLD